MREGLGRTGAPIASGRSLPDRVCGITAPPGLVKVTSNYPLSASVSGLPPPFVGDVDDFHFGAALHLLERDRPCVAIPKVSRRTLPGMAFIKTSSP